MQQDYVISAMLLISVGRGKSRDGQRRLGTLSALPLHLHHVFDQFIYLSFLFSAGLLKWSFWVSSWQLWGLEEIKASWEIASTATRSFHYNGWMDLTVLHVFQMWSGSFYGSRFTHSCQMVLVLHLSDRSPCRESKETSLFTIKNILLGAKSAFHKSARL